MTPDASTSSKPAKAAPSNGSAAPSDAGTKAYQPAAVQPRIWAKWEASGAFHANPQNVLNGSKKPFCILIPPPNVTGALHLGHALNNTLQDILTRAHRMMGYETLWMPGTDHAGIATQAVVEKRLRKEGKLKGPLKTAFTRDEFIAQVQSWKDEYEARITGQLKAMGCSCDYQRQRFTMDPICARAVREAFFRLFKDGLIYRGKRLVNWDPALQTAVADDECYDEEVDTFFWNLRYPLLRGKTPVTWNELARAGYLGANNHPGEQKAWLTVATTRPETYLGDTAVAVNPHDPRAKALRGLHVELPLVGRIIPIVEDSYVVLPVSLARTEEEKNDPKAAYATGFLKVTPAHDQNDAELAQRHNLPAINMMSPDGKVSDKHGWSDIGDAHLFVGLSMADARKKVVAEFEARGLLEATKPYRQSKQFSDRSKAVIEPYLSDQWYVRVTDDRLSGAANRALVPDQRSHAAAQPASASGKPGSRAVETVFPGSKTPLAGTKAPSEAAKTPFPGTKTAFAGTKTPLAGSKTPLEASKTPSEGSNALSAAANVAHGSSENSRASAAGDGSMRFYPARYAKTYEHWHDNIRDWCISRQLWWGHRIPVWRSILADDAGARTEDFQSGVPSARLRETIAGYQRFFSALGQADDVIFRPAADEIQVWLDICARTDKAARAIDVLSIAYGMLFHFADKGVNSITLGISTLRQRLQEKGNPYADAPDEALSLALKISNDMEAGYTQDPDVLDTWFSSALWPLSTMGWPEPDQSAQTKNLLEAFNPTTTLSTAREIITLWVSRMVMMNRYFRPDSRIPNPDSRSAGHGPVPFRDVFIHAVVQDGDGKKMSKTAGNGVDPLDIIETHGADAMRFTLAQMATNTQDVRMPVRKDAKTGKNTSEKFDAGRNFCNKLWNASRFAISILNQSRAAQAAGVPSASSKHGHQDTGSLRSSALTDRWLLSRLGRAIRACETALQNYEFADYAQTLYQLLWWDFCDWYLEAIKPTVEKSPAQQQVLRTGLETILRLLHPVAPFVTEAIHEQLTTALGQPPSLLVTSAWPKSADFPIDEQAEKQFEELRDLINTIRNIRSEHQVLPKRRITLHGPDDALKRIAAIAPGLIENLAGLESITAAKPNGPAVAFRAASEELHLSNLADAGSALDAGAEKDRLTKLLADLKKSEGALAGRLNNPGYAQKAPPKLVEESKAQLAKIQAEIAAAEAKLKSL
jgi:valyl-tRNA synthetase